MNNQNKDQVRSQITNANNILVAVSANPTVDELAASIGLTLALNKLDKHATTVFSGAVPSTIEFLQPEHTIETTTDSLRDFIIALDKSKADKLRYKVEDDVVRIFITPYRTSITQDDLNFTQGDFNVDLVIALGVGRREDLDAAITAHGRILHDATVLSISNAEQASELGSIHWQETQASSLCEMVAIVTAELQQNILDGQMSTAFLTGIVAETDRFKNEKTTPLTLSLSSQLMSAGANQQLIAKKLEPQPIPQMQNTAQSPALDLPYDSKSPQSIGFSSPQDPHPVYAHTEQKPPETPNNDGSLAIDHSENKEEVVEDIHIDEHGTLHAPPKEEQVPSKPTPVGDVLQGQELSMPKDDTDNVAAQQDDESIPEKHESNSTQVVPMPPTSQPSSQDQQSSNGETGNEEVNNVYLDTEETVKEADESPSLKQPKTETPIMKHERVIQPPSDSELAASKKTSDKPFDLNAAEATPGLVPQVQPSQPTAPTPQPSVIPKPSKPTAKPVEQTLSALEKAVESHHITSSAESSTTEKPDVAALQDKAAKAADSVAPQFPSPQEAMQSSAPVSLHTPEPPKPKPRQSEESGDSAKAPPVPPPMAPQFFDADGKNQNPFLNPS